MITCVWGWVLMSNIFQNEYIGKNVFPRVNILNVDENWFPNDLRDILSTIVFVLNWVEVELRFSGVQMS